jgi:hypothetical protein
VAVVIRGASSDAVVTVRGVKSTPAGVPFDVYLVLDAVAPAEALNRTAAVRTEDLILFLDAGLIPTTPNWLKRMADAVATENVGVAVGTLAGDDGSTLAGMLTRRDVFDLLGGFDADRFARSGYLEDYLSRVIGLGYECVAPAEAVFLAGSAQLKRAG